MSYPSICVDYNVFFSSLQLGMFRSVSRSDDETKIIFVCFLKIQ